MSSEEQFSKVSDGLLVRVPAKINLSLLVAGKREDGYHNIETVMAKINWYDEILIEKVASNGCGCDARFVKRHTSNAADASRVTVGRKPQPLSKDAQKNDFETGIELICKGPYKVPGGEDNLVYKAAKLILESGYQNVRQSGYQDTAVKITLTKNIPAGSGLGSGSSDAAATLMGMNKFLKLGLSKKALAGLAMKLGSDVTFFLNGPLAFCTGRGEKVKKIRKVFNFSALLLIPNVSVSTKKVYAHYMHDKALYEKLHGEINALIKKNRIDLLSRMCANMLSKSCFELHNELVELKRKIERLGIGPLCLSGSGSAMFCIINNDNEEGVKKYQHKLQHDFGCSSIIVSNNSW